MPKPINIGLVADALKESLPADASVSYGPGPKEVPAGRVKFSLNLERTSWGVVLSVSIANKRPLRFSFADEREAAQFLRETFASAA